MRPPLVEVVSISGNALEIVMNSLIQTTSVALTAFDDIPDGGCAEVEAWVEGALESLIVHREGERIRAWLNICPHAGRRLDWAAGKFLISKAGHLVCAAHGASFALDDGVCVAGPCRGEALCAVAVKVSDGKVWLA